MGQRDALREIDVLQMNLLYKGVCPEDAGAGAVGMYQQCTFCNFCNRNEIDSKLLYFISIAWEVKFPN